MKFEFIQIDKYSPVPLYEQLKGCLITAIRSGNLIPGQKLPTEDELCRKFGISRPVVRQAYGDLNKLGMLVRKRGSGSFVRSNTDRGIYLMQLVSYREELAMIGMVPGTDLKKRRKSSLTMSRFTKNCVWIPNSTAFIWSACAMRTNVLLLLLKTLFPWIYSRELKPMITEQTLFTAS